MEKNVELQGKVDLKLICEFGSNAEAARPIIQETTK